MPEIYAMLHEDHEKVRRLINRLRNEEHDEAEREDLFETIRRDLEIHTRFEEQSFYPAVRDRTNGETDEEIETAFQEHEEAQEILDDLAAMDKDSDDFLERLEELSDALEQHIHEEETEIFPKAQKALQAEGAEKLGAEYSEFKERG